VKKQHWGFVLGGLLVALLLAGVVSNFASAHPDGLDSSLRDGCVFDAEENVVGGSCPAQAEREHEIGGPLADYAISGVGNDFLSTGLSGVVGVLLTFAVGGGLFRLLRSGAGPRPADEGERVGAGPGTTAGLKG